MTQLVERLARQIKLLTADELAELRRLLDWENPPDSGVREPRRPYPSAPTTRAEKE